MKQFQQKSIPLISRQLNGSYTVNAQAMQFLQSIKEPVGVVSVAGAYRTGKSFLLNTILLNSKAGFQVGPTVNAQTKGIWIWNKLLMYNNAQNKVTHVIVLDTQGLGSTEEDVNHDLKIFSIAVLLSSCFLYNSVGSIDEQSLDRLGVVMRLCEHLKQNPQQQFNSCFPDFYWILRDFSLALVDKNNQPISPNKYLQNSLADQPGQDEGTKNRNKIRQSISKAFCKKYCQTFIRPLTDQSQLQNLSKMKLQELRPEFVHQVLEFRKSMAQNLKVKKLRSKQLRGQQIVQLVKAYTEAINKNFETGEGGLPIIENGWRSIMKMQFEIAFDEVQRRLDNIIKRIGKQDQKGQIFAQIPKSAKQLVALRNRIFEDLEKYFRKKLSKEHEETQIKVNLQKIGNLVTQRIKYFEQDIKKINQSETRKFIAQNYEKNIEQRIKNGQIKSLAELFQQSNTFLSFIRERCPYKQQINQVGLPFLLKKFQQSSFKIFQSFQKSRDKTLDQLNQKISSLKEQFSQKQGKFKKQKDALIKKVAISSSKIDQTERKHKSLAQQLSKIKVGEGFAKNSTSQSCNSGVCPSSQKLQKLSQQNIGLRRKIMQIEESHNDQTNGLKQKISDLEKDYLLKDSLVKQSCEALQTWKQKLFAIQNENRKMKTDFEDKMKKIAQSQRQKSESFEILKRQINQAQKQKIQKNIEIDQIRRLIEDKNKEINQLENQVKAKQRQRKQAQSKKKEYALEQVDEFQQLQRTLEAKILNLQNKLKEQEQQHTGKEDKLKLQLREALKQGALEKQNLLFRIQSFQAKQLKLKKLQEQSKTYSEIYHSKEQQIERLNVQLQEYHQFHQANAEQFFNEINVLNAKIMQLNRQLQAKDNQLTQVNNQMRKQKLAMQNQLAELKEQIKLKEQQIEKLTNNCASIEEQLQKMALSQEQIIESIKDQVRREKEAAQNRFQTSIIQYKNIFSIEQERLKKQLLDQKKKVQEQEHELKHKFQSYLSQTQQGLQEQFDIKYQELMRACTQKDNKIIQLDGKIQSLSEDLNQQRNKYAAQIKKSQHKITELLEKINTNEDLYQEEKADFYKQISDCQQQITCKGEQNIDLKNKIEQLQELIKRNKKKIQTERQDYMKKINSAYESLNEEKKIKKSMLNDQTNTINGLELKIGLKDQQIQHLRTGLQQLRKQMSQKSSRNNADEQHNRKLLIQTKEENQKLRSNIQDISNKYEVVKKQAFQNQRKLHAEIKQQNNKLILSQQKLSQLSVIYNRKISQHNRMKEKSKQQYDSLKLKYEKEVAQLKKILQSQKRETSKIKNQLDEIKYQSSNVQALDKGKIKQFQAQIKQKQEQNEKLMNKNEDLIQQIKKLTVNRDNQGQNGRRFMSPDLKRSNLSSSGISSSKLTHLEQVKESGLNKRNAELQQNLKKSKENQNVLKLQVTSLNEQIADYSRKLLGLMKWHENCIEAQKKLERKQAQYKQSIRQINQQYKKKIDQLRKEIDGKQNQISLLRTIDEKNSIKHRTVKQQYEEQIRKLKDQNKYLSQFVNVQPKDSSTIAGTFDITSRKGKSKTKFSTIGNLSSNLSPKNENKMIYSNSSSFGFNSTSRFKDLWKDNE